MPARGVKFIMHADHPGIQMEIEGGERPSFIVIVYRI
jgi:hypothetical protein